eukprot:c452_g1_i2 orf=237-473(+)
MVYINLLIKLLGEKKGTDMELQTALYSAIDHLKRKSTENVYKVQQYVSGKEPFFFFCINLLIFTVPACVSGALLPSFL